MTIVGKGDGVTELIEVIGKDATLALVENFGGMRLYVSSRMRPNNKVVRAIGPEAALALADRFAPDVINVPVARELRAAHYHSQGMSQGNIAHRLCVSEKGIHRLLKRVKGAS